jgi:hypothetical protein
LVEVNLKSEEERVVLSEILAESENNERLSDLIPRLKFTIAVCSVRSGLHFRLGCSLSFHDFAASHLLFKTPAFSPSPPVTRPFF